MKYPVLGFLTDRPMHGYELKAALSPALPREKRVNDGVLYPLLRKLESEGLIRGKREQGATGAPESCTGRPHVAGVQFAEWLGSDAEEHDEVAYDFLVGHPFLTKCLFFGRLEPAEVARKAAGPARREPRKLGEFKRIRRGMVRARGGRLPHRRARPRHRAAAGTVRWLQTMLGQAEP